MIHIPVILLHGFPMDRRIWDLVIARLDNFDCIAPDLPGYGHNRNAAASHSIENYVEQVVALIESTTAGTAHIVGVSMGGMIAMMLAARYPNRVKSITVLHTTASADDEKARTARSAAIEEIRRIGSGKFVREFANVLLSPATSPAVKDKFIAIMEGTSNETVCGGMEAIRDRPDLTDELYKISCPAQFVAGADDSRSTPELMSRIAALIPGAQFHVIADCGHISPLEKPAECTDLIRSFVLKGDS